jgi:hypothetical protein
MISNFRRVMEEEPEDYVHVEINGQSKKNKTWFISSQSAQHCIFRSNKTSPSPSISLVGICFVLSIFQYNQGVVGVREASSLQNAREDVFSSTSKLEDLVQNEMQVLDLLATYTEYTIEKANLIKS